MTLITQRSAVLNKNVLTQAQTLIAMRTTGPQDVAAIEAWLKYHQQGREILESLSSLEDGEAWVWSPRFLKKTVRMRFRMRETFDSGATPKMSKEARKPATLADVDLDSVKKKMEATIERAKAEDPRALKAKIAELERKINAHPIKAAPAAAKIEIKEVPLLKDAQIKKLEGCIDAFARAVKHLDSSHAKIEDAAGKVQTALFDIGAELNMRPSRPQLPPFRPGFSPAVRGELKQARPASRPSSPSSAPVKSSNPGTQGSTGSLIKGELKILGELAARHPAGYSRSQVGALTGYTPSGGTFGNYFSNLRRLGFIEERGGLVYATQAGISHLGTDVPPAPSTHGEIMAMWQRALVSGAYRMLDFIVSTGNHGITRSGLADVVGMTASGGTFGNYLSILRRNGLVEEKSGLLIATDILWP